MSSWAEVPTPGDRIMAPLSRSALPFQALMSLSDQWPCHGSWVPGSIHTALDGNCTMFHIVVRIPMIVSGLDNGVACDLQSDSIEFWQMHSAGSYNLAGTGKKKSRKQNKGPGEEFLNEMGLGRQHWKRSLGACCCVSLPSLVARARRHSLTSIPNVLTPRFSSARLVSRSSAFRCKNPAWYASPENLHAYSTSCFLQIWIFTGLVTAWMQTCVPFCGAKTEEPSGLWKKAWANATIPEEMLTAMDTSKDPCQDFHEFACGGFIQQTGIKPDQVQWARAWDGIEARISRELKSEVESDQGMAGKFYRACMDTSTIEVCLFFVCMYVCVCMCMCVCVCMYVHIYVCMHIRHTYVHA
jgi:hypothetical protein